MNEPSVTLTIKRNKQQVSLPLDIAWLERVAQCLADCGWPSEAQRLRSLRTQIESKG